MLSAAVLTKQLIISESFPEGDIFDDDFLPVGEQPWMGECEMKDTVHRQRHLQFRTTCEFYHSAAGTMKNNNKETKKKTVCSLEILKLRRQTTLHRVRLKKKKVQTKTKSPSETDDGLFPLFEG